MVFRVQVISSAGFQAVGDVAMIDQSDLNVDEGNLSRDWRFQLINGLKGDCFIEQPARE